MLDKWLNNQSFCYGEFDDFLELRDDMIRHPMMDCWFIHWFWKKVKECEYDANAEWDKVRKQRIKQCQK